ncbi:MAG TPA: 3-dehydroquinate synthase [Desulfobacteraceae bacterium]|nr:3-dehydroquinate synthase [Desulfobacteraceae bacterium]
MTLDIDKKLVRVGLGERSYPIRIEKGLLGLVGRDLQERPIAKRYGVISDDHVASLYGDTLLESLAAAGLEAELMTFPRGEESKNLLTVARLASTLAAANFDRKDGLIALGGGVTGDITGFLASVYMRGIPFVQVPTTLLAQVDSSVGGKTGVDIPEGKNLVGTFHQPRAVYIDTDVLRTLPRQELLGGLAEVIKYGVIADGDFFNFLEQQRERILNLDETVMPGMIARCCEIKAWVVEQDEREGDLRRILNFGHTIGHAIEAASDFTLIHGLAVAMGMAAAADLAVRTGHLRRQEAERLRKVLNDYGLPASIPPELDRGRIKGYLRTDKKTVAGRVFFVLPTRIGEVIITDQVPEADIVAVLVRL